MFAFLRRLFSRYRIVHDPELGYSAQYFDIIGWCGIDEQMSIGCYHRDIQQFPKFYFVDTLEKAGERINKHASNRDQKTVWRG